MTETHHEWRPAKHSPVTQRHVTVTCSPQPTVTWYYHRPVRRHFGRSIRLYLDRDQATTLHSYFKLSPSNYENNNSQSLRGYNVFFHDEKQYPHECLTNANLENEMQHIFEMCVLFFLCSDCDSSDHNQECNQS